jgi:quercetin dioxygenase-like cupin family protein
VVLQAVEHRLADDEELQLAPTPRVIYRVDRNEADYSADAHALVGPLHAVAFEILGEPSPDALLSVELAPTDGEQRLIRCDRVDFPPGGVAYLHTHQGPGIRVLLHGSMRVETEGRSRTYGPLEAWFEPGPEPVFAAASDSEPTAFVRCMLLPTRLRGQRSIRYVREEDAAKPKPQRYTVFVDAPLEPA